MSVLVGSADVSNRSELCASNVVANESLQVWAGLGSSSVVGLALLFPVAAAIEETGRASQGGNGGLMKMSITLLAERATAKPPGPLSIAALLMKQPSPSPAPQVSWTSPLAPCSATPSHFTLCPPQLQQQTGRAQRALECVWVGGVTPRPFSAC